jgi:arylformamidase
MTTRCGSRLTIRSLMMPWVSSLIRAGLLGLLLAPIATAWADDGLLPTAENVSYGPLPRQQLDFWQATGNGPRPLLVHIHGGGWVAGDKALKAERVKPFLDRGISVATVNYRLTGTAPLPAPVHDAARAVQFLRSQAIKWNIRTDRIAATGSSAGACTSMWLLYHDDLANAQSADPVLRESTRLCAAAANAGQTSIDPKVIEPWLGPNVLKHRMIWMAVGEPDMASAMQHYDKHRSLYEEFSPINHVSAGDPPLYMSYTGKLSVPSDDAGHGIHHPLFGVRLKEKADAAGLECFLSIANHQSVREYASADEFLWSQLLKP